MPFKLVKSPQSILLDKSCHVWLVELRISPQQQKFYSSILSPDELHKAERFHFEKDRRSFIAARAGLRSILAYYLKMAPGDIVFDYLKYGKPILPKHLDVEFNLSHSGTYALIAITKQVEIGVDIEEILWQDDLLDIARHYFSDSEYEALIQLPKDEVLRAFYRCWTRKESIIKLLGTGLQLPLNSFVVSLDKDEEFKLLSCDWDKRSHREWTFYSLPIGSSYMAALALEGRVDNCKYYQWQHVEL